MLRDQFPLAIEAIHLFDIPPTATGESWVPVRYATMEAADGVAHLILQSGQSADDPNFGLAVIEESGNVKVIPLDTVTGERCHQWFFGPKVLAELYQFAGEQPALHWSLYDTSTGNRIGTKSISRPAGFSYACFLGDEVSMLAHSAHVEKSRGLPPDTLRLVTMNLE